MKKGTTKAILKYTLTPQVMPRIRTLFFSGFSYISLLMAQIFRAARLLPPGHPYLAAENTGRYGIMHVMAEAGRNLVLRRENSDQIIIYLIILFGLVIMTLQCLMLLAAGFVEAAHATNLYASSTPLNFFTYFQTPVATHDVAFVLLDRVFGLHGQSGPNTSFFEDINGGYTCVVLGQPCFTGLPASASSRVLTPDLTIYTDYARGATTTLNFPWPFHEALRGMLQFYSVGLLVIGAMTFLYFAFAIAVETAETGTAFGRRFNHLWAPVRMVLAIGLLVPVSQGLNPAQWILMYSAKWGSSFATNGWIIYNNAFTAPDTLLGAATTVVATPTAPPVNTLVEFGSILATCYEAYNRIYPARTGRAAVNIDAWLINSSNTSMAPQPLSTSFQNAVNYFDKGTIVVRFGELRSFGQRHQAWDGEVVPFCGEITLDLPYITDDMTPQFGFGGTALTSTEPGSHYIEYQWYRMIQDTWCIASGECAASGANFFGVTGFRTDIGIPMTDRQISVCPASGIGACNPTIPLPSAQALTQLRTAYEASVQAVISQAVTFQQGSLEWQERLTELGWGGAAIWYNKIAQLNGGLTSAVYALPVVRQYPWVMEEVRKQLGAENPTIPGETRHRAYAGGVDTPIDLGDVSNNQIASALFETQKLWRDNSAANKPQQNIFIDGINMIFGTEGLFNITSNEAQNIHPLAQLTTIGRTIVESAIRNLGYSAAAGLGGGLANLFQMHSLGNFSGAASSFLFQIAMIGLSVGFVLFYVIPFMPFVYFFFAVGTWIKTIFEAMVGVPLWALAHIRIDSDGMAGQAAMAGYYLILEVFLRPILIIFGFIASMMIFAAQVHVLHDVWSLVVSNVSGFGTNAAATLPAASTGGIQYLRSAVDELFFTIIYAIICYMMAMASFKLIDQIPSHILRWMGSNVDTFGNMAGDSVGNMVTSTLYASNRMTGALQQAAGGMSGAMRQGSGAIGEMAAKYKG